MLRALTYATVLLALSPICCLALAESSDDVLGRWVGGKWVGDGKLLETDYSKAMAVSGVTHCEWSPEHVFVVCDQQVVTNGQPGHDLSIYAFDPEKKAYRMFGMSPSSEHPRVTELTITADQARWEYLGKTEIGGKSVQFRTVNIFRDADHVDWWSDYSSDGGTNWVRMGEGKESRQK